MATLAQLFVEFGLDAGDWNKGIRAIQKDAKELEKSWRPMTQTIDQVGKVTAGVGAAITAAGIPIVALTKKSIDAADELGKMASRTGASVEVLSALKLQAGLADVSMQGLETAFRNSSRTIEDAASGSKTAAEALGKIGLSAAALLQMSPDERFFAIAKGINAIEDPSLKAGVAMELWGRSGTDIIPMLNGIAGGAKATIAEAQKLNQVITTEGAASAEAFNDAITALGAAFSGLFNSIANSGLLNVLTGIITTIAEIVGGFAAAHPWLTTIAAAFAGLALVIGPLLVAIGLTASGIAALVPIIATVVTAVGAIGAPVLAVIAALTAAVVAVAGFTAALVGLILSNEETRTALTEAWEQIKAAAMQVWSEIVAVLGSAMEQFGQLWAEHGETLVAAFQFGMKVIAEMIKNLASVVSTALKVTAGVIQTFHGIMTADFTKMRQGVEKIWTALWDAIVNVVKRVGNTIINTVKAVTDGVTAKFKAMYDIVVGNSIVPDMMRRIGDEFGSLDGLMVRPAQSAASKVASVFQTMFDRIEQGFRDWKGALKDFGLDVLGGIAGGQSIGDALKGAIGLGGGAGGGGGLGGLFGGGGGAAGAAGAGSVLSSLGGLGGITSAASLAIDQFSKIGAGRRAADEIVKSQNAFTDSIGKLLADSTLSASGKSNVFESLWQDFQSNMARFAATDPNNQKVVNQAFATLAPFVTGIRSDFARQMPALAPAVNGGTVTVNAPLTLEVNLDGSQITALQVRDVVAPELTTLLETGVRGIREKWAQLLDVQSPGTLAPTGI